MWNLTTDAGDLDLRFVPAGTRGFEDLVRDAVRVDITGITLRVASLADVIRSKEAAGREKDRAALPLSGNCSPRSTSRPLETSPTALLDLLWIDLRP
jgi:hypothetical protein